MTDDERPADDAAGEPGDADENLAEIRERAAAIGAELDRWETSDDAAEDADADDLLERLARWETGGQSDDE